jgi:hypothetical protein
VPRAYSALFGQVIDFRLQIGEPCERAKSSVGRDAEDILDHRFISCRLRPASRLIGQFLTAVLSAIEIEPSHVCYDKA